MDGEILAFTVRGPLPSVCPLYNKTSNVKFPGEHCSALQSGDVNSSGSHGLTEA